MMKIALPFVTSLLVTAYAVPVTAAPIVYSGGVGVVSNGGQIGSASYTIQTDGTVGVLSTANLLSFTMTLNPTGMSAASFSGTNLGVSGTALSATATSLSFDFGMSGAGLQLTSGSNYLAFIGGGFGRISLQSPTDQASAIPNSNIIGNVSRVTAPLPEPASWMMMIGGFGMVGAGLRRSQAKAQFA